MINCLKCTYSSFGKTYFHTKESVFKLTLFHGFAMNFQWGDGGMRTTLSHYRMHVLGTALSPTALLGFMKQKLLSFSHVSHTVTGFIEI